MKRKNHLIMEFTEFNLQRMNSDSVQPAAWVMNPSLSIDAHDRHQDNIRQAISRIGSIQNALGGSTMFSNMKKMMSLEEQNLGSLWIQRLLKNSAGKYDVYVRFSVKDKEYWGVVNDIMGSPQVKSEVFTDPELVHTKEWGVRFRGQLVKKVKNWLMPQKGFYRLDNEHVISYCTITGKQMRIERGAEVEVQKSYTDKMFIRYLDENYVIKNDVFIYFNWWFTEIKDDDQQAP